MVAWIALGVLVGGAALGAGWRFAVLRRRPALQSGPIGQLDRGWVEISGTIENTAERTAPISGERVVGFRVLVEREVGTAGWKPVVQLDEWPTLEVRDDSGSAFVEIGGGRLDLEQTRGKGGPFRGIPERVTALLRAHGHGTHGVLFEKAFRWREETLAARAPVRVRGFLEMTPDPAAGSHYRRFALRRSLIGSTRRPVMLVRVG